MRSLILPFLLIFAAAPAYANPETFVDGMRRGGFARLSDEQILGMGQWACDRTPVQAYDEAFPIFDRVSSSASRAQLLTANLVRLANSELCPAIELDNIHVAVADGATFRDNFSIYGLPLFTAAGQINGRSSVRIGNWVNVRFTAANGRDRVGWVHRSEVRLEDD